MNKHWRESVEPFFMEMLPEFEKNLGRDTIRLQECVRSGAYNDVKRIAHVYKGSAGYFGLTDLHQLAMLLEHQCKENDTQEIEASLAAWERLIAELEIGRS